jgi:hypothetical protein
MNGRTHRCRFPVSLLAALAFAGCTTIQQAGNADNPTPPADSGETPVVFPDANGESGPDLPPDPIVEAVEDVPADPSGDEAPAPDLAEPPPDVPEVIDVKEVKPDGPCEPNCTGKVCGSDGCDGICGFCPYGWACNQYGTVCSPICTPNCAGKSCGPDGCGGVCGPPALKGECEENYKCNTKIGACEPETVCTPECGGRVCGNGGCEGDEFANACGTCAESQSCTDDGLCIAGPCAGVHPTQGACKGLKALSCVKDPSGNPMLLTVDCSNMVDMICGWDPWKSKFGCIKKPPCEPSCKMPDSDDLKECGDDGCGHETCGQCPVGWGCPAFRCRPIGGATCGWITSMGFCWPDNVLYWCSSEDPTQGAISSKNCNTEKKMCAYVQSTQAYDCL